MSQPLRWAALALALPWLLVTPGQAGMLLLHQHCNESTHLHRFGHADLDAWQDDHAEQHSCPGPAHHGPGEPEVVVGKSDCDHDDPILIVVTQDFTRPTRSDRVSQHARDIAAPATNAVLLAPVEHHSVLAPPPPSESRFGLATLDAIAAILLRNHALLL